MTDEELIALAKDMFGMSDEDIARVSAEEREAYKNFFANSSRYRLVAEVVKSKYCVAGVQVGQKIAFNGVQIDKQASDCPLCVGAIAPLSRHLAVYTDRCYRGGDMTAPLPGLNCVDPGIDAGGFGNVQMKVRIEPLS